MASCAGEWAEDVVRVALPGEWSGVAVLGRQPRPAADAAAAGADVSSQSTHGEPCFVLMVCSEHDHMQAFPMRML